MRPSATGSTAAQQADGYHGVEGVVVRPYEAGCLHTTVELRRAHRNFRRERPLHRAGLVHPPRSPVRESPPVRVVAVADGSGLTPRRMHGDGAVAVCVHQLGPAPRSCDPDVVEGVGVKRGGTAGWPVPCDVAGLISVCRTHSSMAGQEGAGRLLEQRGPQKVPENRKRAPRRSCDTLVTKGAEDARSCQGEGGGLESRHRLEVSTSRPVAA